MPICQSIAVLRGCQRTYAVWLLGGSKLPEGIGSGPGGQGSGLRGEAVLWTNLTTAGAPGSNVTLSLGWTLAHWVLCG